MEISKVKAEESILPNPLTEFFSQLRGWVFYGPNLDKEKRKEMIKSFTETAGRLTGIRKSAFTVYLRESTSENVGVGGKLFEDVLKKS